MSSYAYVYIHASQRNGTLYTGVTSDLIKRVQQHRNGDYKGFSYHYNVKKLVYYEGYDEIEDAITREKQIKKWYRAWKLDLIEQNNPEWKDLYDEIIK